MNHSADTDPGTAIPLDSRAFGPFVLHVRQRMLTRDGTRIAIGSRAMDLLTALVERAGEVIAKSDLMQRAWPHSVVDESAIRVQMSSLRRVLGDGTGGRRYIVSITQRGYQFVAPVEQVQRAVSASAAPMPSVPAHALPAGPPDLVGRTQLLAELAREMDHYRCLTIAGAPGVGKSAVALALAWQLEATYDTVHYIDVAADNAQDHLPLVMPALARAVRPLLVLDNCEPMLEQLSVDTVELLHRIPALQLIVTSRESLRIPGEAVRRIAALAVSPASGLAVPGPAQQLFLQCYNRIARDRHAGSTDMQAVSVICSQLEGNPLAIEMAAARAVDLGIAGMVQLIADPLRILTRGRRHAPPRHASLRAAIDWSYQLLHPGVQRAFCLVASLRGEFNFAQAAQLCGPDAADDIGALVASSLLSVTHVAGVARFRMPALLRCYALEQCGDGA